MIVIGPNGSSFSASSADTLTNKSIDLATNTVTGTRAQFDTACSDGNFVYQSSALGTPSSGTGTNITGIPAANILAGTLGTGDYRITGKLGTGLAPTYALDISGTPGTTARFFDQTATTGDTKVLIQSGAGQAANLLTCTNTLAQTVCSVANSGSVTVGSLTLNGIGGGNITGESGMDIRASGFAAFTITNPLGTSDMLTYKAGGTSGVTAGPFTVITGITVKGGIVTALTGS